MAYLVLVRHGESQWNKLGKWTGLTDIPITEKGIEQAKLAGKAVKDIKFDLAYTSKLIRAKQTLDEIKKVLKSNIPTFENEALNEKDYGDYTGKNKWQIKKEVGDETFLKIRRSWDYRLPNGESLKDVYNRTIPYYEDQILPQIIKGKNIIISAHNNSLRALVKYLDNVSDEDIPSVELGTGEAWVYKMDKNGNIILKEVRNKYPDKGKQ